MDEIIYKRIKGCVKNYRISNIGKVEVLRQGQWRPLTVEKLGNDYYVRLVYYTMKYPVPTSIGRLMAEAFIRRERNKLYKVFYKDGNRGNWTLENLSWKELDFGKRKIYALLINGKEKCVAGSLSDFLRNVNYDENMLVKLINKEIKLKGVEVYVGVREDNTDDK